MAQCPVCAQEAGEIGELASLAEKFLQQLASPRRRAAPEMALDITTIAANSGKDPEEVVEIYRRSLASVMEIGLHF